METLNYAKGVTLNFNLRKPLSKRPTNLYAVVKLSGKQIKIPTTAKICAYLWNSQKQLPVFSEDMSEVDLSNAMSVSSIIFSFRRAFADFYLYLCNQKEVVTAHEVRDYFTEKVLSELIINNYMAKNGAPNVKRERKATVALLKALELYSSVKGGLANSTITTYNEQLKAFINYCKVIKRDSIRMLSEKEINNFEIYLRDNGNSENKIRNSLRILRILINDVMCKHPYFKNYGLKKVDIDLPKNIKSEELKVELLDMELEALRQCKDLSQKQEEFRDLFLLECFTGQRASDLPTLFNPEIKIEDNYFSFLTKKEKVPALVEMTPDVLEIIERYRNGFEAIDITKEKLSMYITNGIKLIAKNAHLDRLIEYIDNKKRPQKRPLYEVISSHFGRHTFITKKIREGVPIETLKYLTGHKDTQALQKYYIHLNANDRVNLVNNALKATITVSAEVSILKELIAYDKLLVLKDADEKSINIEYLEECKDVIRVIRQIPSITIPANIDKAVIDKKIVEVFPTLLLFADIATQIIFIQKIAGSGISNQITDSTKDELIHDLQKLDNESQFNKKLLEIWQEEQTKKGFFNKITGQKDDRVLTLGEVFKETKELAIKKYRDKDQ